MRTMVPKLVGYTLSALLAISPGAFAGQAFPQPLPVANQTPLVGIFGIPKAMGANILGKGQTQWDINLSVASHFSSTERVNESIFLDGETARVAIQVRHGISDRWNIGIEIPWVHHGGGALDSFIINWHDFWGFPQGGRDDAARNRIKYLYERDGVTRIDMDSAAAGPGDITVSAQRQMFRSPRHAAVLHTQVKLSTGKADKLTGSGAVDFGAGFELSRQWHPKWHSTFHAGVAYLGDGDILPDLRRNQIGYGGFDLVWRPLDALALRVQFHAHTAPYRGSAMNELSKWSGLLATGGTWYITRNTSLDMSVVEDVPNTDAAPDVTFQLRLRTQLGNPP